MILDFADKETESVWRGAIITPVFSTSNRMIVKYVN